MNIAVLSEFPLYFRCRWTAESLNLLLGAMHLCCGCLANLMYRSVYSSLAGQPGCPSGQPPPPQDTPRKTKGISVEFSYAIYVKY